MINIDDKLKEWKILRDLLFKVRDKHEPFWKYLEARNAYELKYHEKFDKLKMPY